MKTLSIYFLLSISMSLFAETWFLYNPTDDICQDSEKAHNGYLQPANILKFFPKCIVNKHENNQIMIFDCSQTDFKKQLFYGSSMQLCERARESRPKTFKTKIDSIEYQNAKFGFKLSEPWFLTGKKKGNGENSEVYEFKRDPVFNDKQIKIIPAILIVFERTDETLEPILYSARGRSMFQLTNVDKVMTHEDKVINLKSAIIYIGSSLDKQQNILYKMIVTTIPFGKNGIVIAMIVTDDVYLKVKNEYFDFLKSLSLTTDEKIQEMKNKTLP